MRAAELIALGIPRSLLPAAQQATREAARSGIKRAVLRRRLQAVADSPGEHRADPLFGELAALIEGLDERRARFRPRSEPAPWTQFGSDIDDSSIRQMQNACALPVSVRGALMPDAHVGYGLPIGGVLATRDAVVPYAVGVDIACRVKLTVLDLPVSALDGQRDRLEKALVRETRFGIGAAFDKPHDHPVMDEDWAFTRITRELKGRAWKQLGTSGSGNHFVELGEVEIERPVLGLEAGHYLGLLSHSGSRGPGARIADHYSRLARDLHPELPKELAHLAWLDLAHDAGAEYWAAMELMGRYAAANHAVIHRQVVRALSANVLLDLENHHNFAWRERHHGEELIVHRKGATPAGDGVLGVIPGTMASPTHIVRGLGNEGSLRSAAHGAGRRMSRKQAKSTLTWSEARKLLADRGVHLLSAGLDEVPMVYKEIGEVMAAQSELVETLALFHPRIVRMAPEGERAED